MFQGALAYHPTSTTTSQKTNTSAGSSQRQNPGAATNPSTPAAPTPTATTPDPSPTTPPSTATAKPAPVTASPIVVPTPTPPAADSEIASEATCPGQTDVSQTTTVLVCLTSHARTYHSLGAVTGNTSLMQSAAAKASDIATCGFSHTACGREFGYWIQNKGYTIGCYAENIAQGQKTPGEVFVAWMNSPGHRANILTASYKDLGVAYLANGSNPVWVMHLGGC